ncbi:MAG: GxxExxY protein, partial [Myxococcota bacterium]
MNPPRPQRLPALSLRHGLSPAILEDRVCAETLDAALAVHEALGVAHTAATYRNALAIELVARGLAAHRRASFSVLYRGQVVGSFDADLLVEERLLVQVVAGGALSDDVKSDTVRGLVTGGVKLVLLFRFGA